MLILFPSLSPRSRSLAGFLALALIPFFPLLVKLVGKLALPVKMPPSHTLQPQNTRDRIVNFSDGVFSLAITLIVLNIDALEASTDGASVIDKSGRPIGRALARALRANWDQCGLQKP